VRWQSRAAIDCNKKKTDVCKTNFTQSIQFPLFLYILSKPKKFNPFTLLQIFLGSATVMPTCAPAKRSTRTSPTGASDSSARVLLAKYHTAKAVGLSAGYSSNQVLACTHLRHAVCSHVPYGSVYTASMGCCHRRRGTGVQPQVNY